MQSSKRDLLIITFVGLCCFILGTYHQEFISFDVRFALFAKEMLTNGPGWFPTTYHHPYPDYPVLPTFFIYLSAKLLGGQVTKLSAVLPTAIASTLTLIFTYCIGATQQRKWGWFAVGLCLLTFTFVIEARHISIDQYITCITTISFYLALSSEILNTNKRLYWLPLLFLLGFFCRGPIGLIIPACVVGIYFLLSKRYCAFFLTGLLSFLLLIIVFSLLLLLAYHVGGNGFMHQVLIAEVIGRITTQTHPPWYFYLWNNLGDYALAYPFALLTCVGFLLGYQRLSESHRMLLLKLMGWFFIILVGLSLAGDKKARYILSITPAIALLASYPLVFCPTRFFSYIKYILASVIFLIPYVGLTTFLIALKLNHAKHYDIQLHSLLLILILLLSILFAWAAIFYKKGFAGALVPAIISVLSIIIFVVEPVKLTINHQRDFVQTAENFRLKHQANLAFYQISPDGGALLYLVNTPDEPHAYFIKKASEMSDLHSPTLFVSTYQSFSQLPHTLRQRMHIVAKTQNLHHYTFVAFSLSSHKKIAP